MSQLPENLVRVTAVVDLINRHVEGAHVNEVHAKGDTVTIRVFVDDEAAWQRTLEAVTPWLKPAFVIVPAYVRRT